MLLSKMLKVIIISALKQLCTLQLQINKEKYTQIKNKKILKVKFSLCLNIIC
jgi:hypothetical protein